MDNTSQDFRETNTNLSYLRIRKWIGTFGLLLPILAPLLADEKLPSISDYYYTESGVYFTSLLILIGVFLASYRGYDRADNIITWIGGVGIALVAIIPTPLKDCCLGNGPTPTCSCVTDLMFGLVSPGTVHFGSAGLFFLCMSIMLIRQFTKGDLSKPGKKLRNLVYRVCGYGILVTLVFTAIMIFGYDADVGTRFVFWTEVVMLILFAIAWLLKGKALKDLANTFTFNK